MEGSNPAEPAVSVSSEIRPGAHALPYGSSLFSVGEMRCPPCPTNIPQFTVFCGFPIFPILWVKMGQHGPTHAPKRVQAGPQMAQHGPQAGPT